MLVPAWQGTDHMADCNYSGTSGARQQRFLATGSAVVLSWLHKTNRPAPPLLISGPVRPVLLTCPACHSKSSLSGRQPTWFVRTEANPACPASSQSGLSCQLSIKPVWPESGSWSAAQPQYRTVASVTVLIDHDSGSVCTGQTFCPLLQTGHLAAL